MHASDERARWLARNVLPHEPRLRAWLSRRPVTGLDVDDIIQETYAKLSELESVDAIYDAKNYIFRTANSVIVTHLRRARIVPMHSFAQFDGEDFASDAPDPEAVAVDRDELTRVGQAIAELPPRMREVFILRRIEGLSQRQVAERLGVSESTVEKQMGLGFHRLAKIFGRGGNRRAQASKLESEDLRQGYGTGDQPGD